MAVASGAFVEAWVRTHGADDAARRDARALPRAPPGIFNTGLGHLTEIADGDPPHAAHGCPFQAWSLAELLRLERQVLAEPEMREALAPSGMRDPAHHAS